MKGIRKKFGAVVALDGVDFDVGHGEVVGLVGDNGAGKSTLVKILTGVYQPDEGEILLDGKKVAFESPTEARNAGIEAVHQYGGVVDTLDIARNFFIGREIVRKWGPFKFLDLKKMREESLKMVKKVGIQLRSEDALAATLSGGQRQAISIGRAMYFKARLVILDEPTNHLSIKEVDTVLDFVREIKKQGTSVIFVTHNIYHVYDVADRLVVLDRAKKIAEFMKTEVTPEDVIDTIRYGTVSRKSLRKE
ncbi:MAG: sugar ABC transporter ATP-binding protein [Thermotogae bacterium]|nr:sugar ABC transporter ATP-binding protein [Thermotogota bacterium]